MSQDIIGFVQMYGLTPCINFFDSTNLDLAADDRELNVLISETSDLRHVLKSLSDALPLETKRRHPVHLHIHEKNLECLGRDLLFLTIICETTLSKRERMELFCDLYGNTMLRDKTDAYLQGVVQELIQLVTEDERCPSVLTKLIDFSQMKFK